MARPFEAPLSPSDVVAGVDAAVFAVAAAPWASAVAATTLTCGAGSAASGGPIQRTTSPLL